MATCELGHEYSGKDCRKCYHKNWRAKNRERTKGYIKNFKDKNPDWHKEYRKNNLVKIRDYMLKYNFGISIEEYNKKLLEQDYCCAICKKPAGKGKLGLHVDHSHETGRVRDLLCGNCNRSLGLLKEDKIIINGLLLYLEKWK